MSGTSSPASIGTSSAANYGVRSVDVDADRAAILELWAGHAKFPPEWKYDWFYVGNPFEGSRLLLLTHGPNADGVGVAGLGTRHLCIQGKARTAGLLGDLIVEPRHRTLFPALMLQRRMQADALLAHGIAYGFPNKNSKPVVRRLGYLKQGELIRYSRLLRHSSYLERHMPRPLSTVIGALADRLTTVYFAPYLELLSTWKLAWVDRFDERFDTLWERFRDHAGVVGVRDSRFLSWRFLSQPGHHYRICVVKPRGNLKTITAYAVCEAIDHVLHVRDFLVDPAHAAHSRLLFHWLARAAYREGFSVISVEFLGSQAQRDTLRRAGLIERADRSEMYVSFAENQPPELRELDWYMTSADEDE